MSTGGFIERVAGGDASAVEQCIAEYGGLVWTLARRMSATTADAEDAVQEIFVQLWQQAERYDPKLGSEPGFVTMIARRRLIDRLRKATRRPSPEPLIEAPEAEPEKDYVGIREEAELARRCMDSLKAEERDVLRLALESGLSQSEIADRLGMPLGTVKSHARRGLIKLRERLAGQQPAEPAGETAAVKGGVR